MLTKTLIRNGNSAALVIDKPLLKLMGIGQGDLVEIAVRGQSLIVTPSPRKM